MSTNGTRTADAVKDTIYRACLCMDDGQWGDFLSLCDESLNYTIAAFSPEISRDMIYFSADHGAMKTMLEQLPKHNTDHSPLKRHATVYTVDCDEDNKTASAVTSFVIYQNMLDGVNSHLDAGESHLFLIGKYMDKFTFDGEKAKLVDREVRLDTRRLDKGSHYIL